MRRMSWRELTIVVPLLAVGTVWYRVDADTPRVVEYRLEGVSEGAQLSWRGHTVGR